MKASEVKKLLNIPYNRIQHLRREGVIKATPKNDEKWLKGGVKWEYDEESVIEYQKLLIDNSYIEGEMMLQAVPVHEWRSKMLTQKDKLYGFNHRLKVWLPFHKINEVNLISTSGRIGVKGISQNKDKLYIQIHRKFFPKIIEKGWLNEWNHIFDQVYKIIEDFLNGPNRKTKFDKLKQWRNSHRRVLYPSELYS